MLAVEEGRGELKGGGGPVTIPLPTATTVAGLSGRTVTGTLPGNGTVFSNINLDECYAGVYGIPFIGRIRGGHMKVPQDRKSTRLNSSHQIISYSVFCLKKKKTHLK